jgi:hypothetical protein
MKKNKDIIILLITYLIAVGIVLLWSTKVNF